MGVGGPGGVPPMSVNRSLRDLFTKCSIAILAALLAHGAMAEEPLPYRIEGDRIPLSLTGQRGDAARGRAIITSRQTGLCLLCHSGPFPEAGLQGNLAPSLDGVGRRLSEGQLRLRLVDARRVSPASLMPAYYRTEGRRDVAPAFAGKPLLTAAEIEDVLACLQELR
jgi:sulfur-oxidizing protein SoxX